MSHSQAGRREVETKVFYDEHHGVWSSPNACTIPHVILELDMEISARSRYQDPALQPTSLSLAYRNTYILLDVQERNNVVLQTY
jgi:hypothetical protein